jgi:hypothetical protein
LAGDLGVGDRAVLEQVDGPQVGSTDAEAGGYPFLAEVGGLDEASAGQAAAHPLRP